MKEYSAYLTFPAIDQNRVIQIKALAESVALQVDVGETFLEFEYSGRDSSRQVVRFLYELAKLLHHASGEVKCELVNDDGYDDFEFYRISEGRLICQIGRIVRGQEAVIDFKDSPNN